MRQSRPKSSAVRPVALVFVAVAIAWGGARVAAQDASPANVAGIVVDYGDGHSTYAIVAFEEASISGVELLRRSGLSLLTVEFGGLGEGVCAIEETGCDLSACRTRLCQTGDPDSPFWHYVREGGDGAWLPAPLGASSSTIENGDVDGWFWTGAAPADQSLTLDQIALETGIDLTSYATSAGTVPEPVLISSGDPADDGALDRGSVIGGIAVVAGVAAIGGLLIRRSRQAST